MSKNLFLGIDTASRENYFALINSEGNPVLKDFRLPNSLPGAEALVQKLLELHAQTPFQELVIGTEATSFYDWHLLEHLAQSPLKERVKITFYRLNARQLHHFKKSFPYKGRDDRQDAYAIAERLRFGKLPEPYLACNPYLPPPAAHPFPCPSDGNPCQRNNAFPSKPLPQILKLQTLETFLQSSG